MKLLSSFLLFCVAMSGHVRAEFSAVLSAAREFHASCERAIPDAKLNDPGAIGHILHLRLTEIDGEIAVLDGLRLQLDAAQKRKNEAVIAYCLAFTARSLDMLEHLAGQTVDSLKIAGIAVPVEVSESNDALLKAVQSFYREPQNGSPEENAKKG